MAKFFGCVSMLILTVCLVACNQVDQRQPLLGNRILVWHSWDEAEAQILDELLDNFNAIHPQVTIMRLTLPPNELRERFKQRARLGLGPDLLIGPSDWLRELADEGLIADISRRDDLDTLAFNATALATVRYRDGVYGLPLSVHTTALYYNKNMIAEPPETVEQLLFQAQGGKQVALVTNFEAAFWGVGAFGGQLFDDEQRVILSAGGFANWLGWLNRANDTPGMILDAEDETLYAMFKQEQVTYYIGSSEKLTDLQGALGQEVVGVAPLPAGPNGSATPFLKSEVLMFSPMSSPNQTELVLDLANFLTNAEQQNRLARDANRIPANVRVSISRRVFPAVAAFIRQSKTAIAFPNLPQMDDLQEQGSRAYLETLTGSVEQKEAARLLTESINRKYGLE